MYKRNFVQLIHFLEADLAIPTNNLLLALRHTEHTPNLLPMILWQYGFVTISELDQIFDWLIS
ncbi:MAG: DUF2949 domain-containing protein [Methylacidiphilales bacterium]|nr:DUF2949 domain-containing protein [Candidatus Methylacidiphilales bacterium]NJR19346.1 DUF2949 domain-containing protein [Calothrix sp. CSU_2_0]